jgi:hypothetical protein
MSQIIDKGTVNGIKYFKYQPDIAGANPYFITYRDRKLFFTNSISRTTTRKDFNKPVKYDGNSKRLLVGPFNFLAKDYSKDLRRLDKVLDVSNYQDTYLRSSTQPVSSQPLSIGKEPDDVLTQEPKVPSNPVNNITEDNIVYPIYHYGNGKGSDNPMLMYKENGQTMLRRLNKNWKNLKGDNRFYKYDDNKKRTYVVDRYDKDKGVATNLSLRINDHKPLGSKNNLNTPSAYRNIDYQFGGGETNLRFKSKSKNSNLIDFGTRKIPPQDHTTYTGQQGITLKDEKGNDVNYVAGMTAEERKLTDLPKTDSMDNREVRFPKSRSYDYVVLNSGGGEPDKFEFIVRKGDKLYLTNSLPRNVNDIETRRPITYNKNTGVFDIQDYSGAPSRRISKDKLQFLSGMGKNSITGKDMSRNSINDGLENFAQRKLQQEPEPKPEPKPETKPETKPEPKPEQPISLSPRNQKTSPQPEQPKTPVLKPNDAPKVDIPEIEPEPKGDATGQIRDVGGVEGITQQDEGIALISADEVNLNVVDEKTINPYLVEEEKTETIDFTKPDGEKMTVEDIDKLKASYGIDRYDDNLQSKSFEEYIKEILSVYPKELLFFLNESDATMTSFYTFLSMVKDEMNPEEEDLYQFYGNDMYKGATRSVPLVLNPNSTEQEDVDYVLQDRFTQDSFGSVILGGLMYRTLGKERVVLKNSDGVGIEEETFLSHTDNALKSRVAKNLFTPAKMNITQMKFFLTLSLATIYAHRQRKLPPHRLNNTIIRIINSIPYAKYNIPSKAVEDLHKEFRRMYVGHPMPFSFSLLSDFYEQVILYTYESNPEADFEYLFKHISEDLRNLVPSIEKAFRTRQDFKEFILSIYKNKDVADKRFQEYNDFIRGRRKLNAEEFSKRFSDGSNIFSENTDEGEEYDIFNETTGTLVERVLIPYDESKKAITLFINDEGRFYESREEDRAEQDRPDVEPEQGTETFKTDVLKESDLPVSLLDRIKEFGSPYLSAILTGATGHNIGKLFQAQSRDAKLESMLAMRHQRNGVDKLNLLGFDPEKYIASETVDELRLQDDIIGGYGTGEIKDYRSNIYTPMLDKALLSKKIQEIQQPSGFLGSFYRNIPSFDEIIRLAGKTPLYDFGPQRPQLGRQDSSQLDRTDFTEEELAVQKPNPLTMEMDNYVLTEVSQNGMYDHKTILRVQPQGTIKLIPKTFKIFDNLFYKLTFGNLDNQMWVGINPDYLIPLRPILAVGAGVLISNYLLRKRTPLERIREMNKRGDKVLDLSIGRPLEISSRVGLKNIIEKADKVFFHSFELKKYDTYFYEFKLKGNRDRVELKENWQDLYIKEIIDPFFQKYGKYMNQEEKFMEIARFVISAQAFDQGFDQRLYTPSTGDLFIDNLRKSLTPRAFKAIASPQGYLDKDFWIVFESLTFRFRKLVFEQHNLSYENLENGTKMLEADNFVSTLNRLDFIADELPDVKKETINMEHIDDKADMIQNENLVPRKSDLRYLNLAKLAYQVNQIGYDMLTLFPKPILEQNDTVPNLRKAYQLTTIPDDILEKFNIRKDKLTRNFGIFDPEYFTDDLRDFVLIIDKNKQTALIGIAGSKMSFSAGTFRDWALTNMMNVNIGVGLISQFRARAKIIFDTIKDRLRDNSDIYIAGHSMGAAVANNLAFQLNRYKYNLRLHCMGFATPAFLTSDEQSKFTDEMKNTLYKNYYIYNDIVGKIGINLKPPEDNNIILYEDGWKDIEVKSTFFNSLRKAKDTYTKNTHAIILYGKYLRIAVSKGEAKTEKEETKEDEILNFYIGDFIKNNPDIEPNLVNNLMLEVNHKRIREEMERSGLSLNDTIRKMLRDHQALEQEKRSVNKPVMTEFSDSVPAPEGFNFLDYVKNLNIKEFLSSITDPKPL